jgi:hypothetical protein
VLQVVTDDAASGIGGIFIKVPFFQVSLFSGSYPLDLSGVEDPAGSNANADLALRVTGTHKLLHHNKVEIPSGGIKIFNHFPTYIKCAANEIQVFKLALKRFLLSNSFYSTKEYFNSNK